MTINNNINVNISLDATAVTGAGFGKTMCVGGSTFTPELTRTYASAAEVATDSALLTSLQTEALNAIFGGVQKPTEAKAGTVAVVYTAQVVTYIIGSAEDGNWTITIDGTPFTFAASSSTAANIRDGLVTAINLGSVPVTAAPVTTVTLTLTADVAGTTFTYTNSVPTSGVITETLTTPNANPATSLDALLAEDSDWYGLVIDDITEPVINSVAAWAEANDRLFMARTADAGVRVLATTTDVASDLAAAAYEQTGIISYLDAATKRPDASWMGGKLSADPDIKSTTWSYYALTGVPVESINSTTKNALDSKNCNYYTKFYGAPATSPGINANGRKLDIIITAAWIKARLEEDFAQILLNASAANTKIPYDDDGIQVFANAMKRRIAQGEDAGHFLRGSVTYTIPARVDVSASNVAVRLLQMGFVVEPAGAIEKVTITGIVAIAI